MKKPARGKAHKSSSTLAKGLKLLTLVGAMLCIGFFAVLVVDVSMTLVGKVKLGEVTVVQLWHKMTDRVLDRDVPRADPPVARATPKPRAQPTPTTRAPLPAVRPEDDARHVVEPEDPQVQRAKQRLDDLLGRL